MPRIESLELVLRKLSAFDVSGVAEPESAMARSHHIVLSSRSGSRQERHGRRSRRALGSAAVAGRRGACPVGAFQLKVSVDQDLSVIVADLHRTIQSAANC